MGDAAAAEFLTKGLDSLSLKDVEGVTPRLSETLIASQLNQLSVNERDSVLQDIHGVAELIDESPSFVQQSLTSLQEELDAMVLQYQKNNPQSTCALEMALNQELTACLYHSQQSSFRKHSRCSLLGSTTFRLSFLRAAKFEPKNAAERIFQHFQEKLELFGPDKLTKDILIQDLDEETMECLGCGRMQLLPQRDRAVLVGIRKLHKEYRDFNSLLRAFWYLGSVAAEDAETQRKGVVIVQYNVGVQKMASRDVVYGLARVLKALPLRAASIHACVSDSRVKAAATIAALLIGSNNTVRFRCHSGSDMEVQYALMTFGLPINGVFPVSPMGDLDLSRHTQFLQQRRNQESAVPSPSLFQTAHGRIDGGSDFVDELLPLPLNSLDDHTMNDAAMTSNRSNRDGHVLSFGIPPPPSDASPAMSIETLPAQHDISPVNIPGELDILLGRGKSFQNHKGNLRYRQIVESYREQYEGMRSKREKTRLIKDVVQVIFDGGGRFLRQDSLGRWVPVDLEMTRDKVSHSFRNQRRLSQKSNGTSLPPAAASKPNPVMSHRMRTDNDEQRDAKRARNNNMEED
ncbi:MAG: hypothetical protein SGARI_001493 [Bacillariaceae sp.]